MKANEQQIAVTNQLTTFLKTFKQSLSAKIHIFYSIMTKGDTYNLIAKIKQKQNIYHHTVPQPISINDQTVKIIQRFSMRISQFLDYRLCVLKSLKQQWLSNQINCFQGSLKKIFAQSKAFHKLDILIKRIIDCKNIFAKNILTQVIKGKYIQGQEVTEVKKLFQQCLLKSINLQQPNANNSYLQDQFVSKSVWNSQIDNNPFIQKVGNPFLNSYTEYTKTYYQKPTSVGKVVNSIVQGQNNLQSQIKKRPVNIKLSNAKGFHLINNQACLSQGNIMTQPTFAKKQSSQQNSPKLPSLRQRKSEKTQFRIKTQTLYQNKKTGMTKQQYFDNIRKAMALQDTYWIVNSTYAQLIRQLKQLNRKNQNAILRYGAKCKKKMSKSMIQKININLKKNTQRQMSQESYSPNLGEKKPSKRFLFNTKNNFNANNTNSMNGNNYNKLKANLLKTQTARGDFGNFNRFANNGSKSKIKTLSSNQTRTEQTQISKIQLSFPDNYMINQIQKRLYSVIN